MNPQLIYRCVLSRFHSTTCLVIPLSYVLALRYLETIYYQKSIFFNVGFVISF